MMRARMAPLLRSALLFLVIAAGCRAVTTSYDYPDDLRHPNYVKRSKAVQQFAELKDERQLPEAFSLLLDEEPHIRLLAHSTLRSLSPGGEDFGYRAYLPPADRIRIAERWRAWWTKTRTAEASGG